MGTRTLIRFKATKDDNCDVMIYKHWDGSPESTLPWLIDRVINFTEHRGNDYGYFCAYLLKTILTDGVMIYNIDNSTYTGFGVFNDIKKGKDKTKFGDYGSEFIYTIDLKNKQIEVQSGPRKKKVIDCKLENLNKVNELFT